MEGIFNWSYDDYALRKVNTEGTWSSWKREDKTKSKYR